ncbi:MAG: spermidine synthase [Microbacteriaceae bacterium]
MRASFEELDWQETPMGELNLRRRIDPALGLEVFEVKLGDEYLMSSVFTVAEIELARLGLAAHAGTGLSVMVGGLGLGYTAQAVLEHESVAQLTVVEALSAVVGWHERGLLPVSSHLTDDARTTLTTDDYFALMRRDPERLWDAILVDIDHSPKHWLNSSHGDFYTTEGLQRMARHLAPGGVFALWSDDPPETQFMATLDSVFAHTEGHTVSFPNALTGGESTNGVYVAHAVR